MGPQLQTPRSVALSGSEMATLQAVAGRIIPPSAELDVPGANDTRIFSDIVGSFGRYREDIGEALRLIETLAGGSFVELSEVEQMATLTQFRAGHPVLAASLGAVIARCYYRDDRVMNAVGVEARAPFPRGFEVDRGDWSLLDPVRKRGKIYRDPDQGRDE